MIDILFINPPIDEPEGLIFSGKGDDSANVGLCCLATNLEKTGFKTKIIDMYSYGYSENDIIRYVKCNRPKIIGIHCNSLGLRKTFSLINKLKKIKQDDFKIIVGGPHITAEPEIIKELNVDYGMIGDCDLSIIKFCKNMINGNQYDKIDGLVKIENDEIKIESQEIIQDLNILPLSNYDLFLRKKIKWNRIWVDGARGCMYNCYFCPTATLRCKKIIYPDYNKIVDNIKEITIRYNPKMIEFTSENFTADCDWIIKFCEKKISEGIKIKWGCFAGMNEIDKGIVLKLAKSNCVALSFGIESGSKKVRQDIGKIFKADLNKCKEITQLCRKLGMSTTFFFIIGLPCEESIEVQVDESINFFKYTKPTYSCCSFYHVIPGSKFYYQLIKNNEMKDNMWVEFMHGGSMPVYIPRGYTLDDLKRFQMKFYRNHYLTISSFLYTLICKDFIKLQFLVLWGCLKEEILKPLVKYFYKMIPNPIKWFKSNYEK